MHKLSAHVADRQVLCDHYKLHNKNLKENLLTLINALNHLKTTYKTRKKILNWLLSTQKSLKENLLTLINALNHLKITYKTQKKILNWLLFTQKSLG